MDNTDNIYKPKLMKIEAVIDETPDVRTLRLGFLNPEEGEEFTFKAGQFGLYSVFGEGECTFCIASPPTRKGYIECSFKLMGKVTNALRNLEVGDIIGFRGPYGNSFPLEEMEGKNLIFIAGGIGLAPVRCLFWNCLDLRGNFKEITMVYGARTVADLVYKRELKEWAEREDVRFVKTVDPGGQTPDWDGEIGFVPPIVEKVAPSPKDALAIVCGPPIMIKFTLPVMKKLGFSPSQILTTMENKMKCGLGKCGRCNIGPIYVCKEGPVFTAEQLEALPDEY